MGKRLRNLGLALLGIALFLAIGIALESEAGIPFVTLYRIACAVACLGFMAKLGADQRGARWPWIAVAVAFLVDIGLFFTPLMDRPASRGEIMLFAAPDALIFLSALLAARIVAGPPADDRARAVRQQIMLGIVVALAACALLFGLLLAGSASAQALPLPPRIAAQVKDGHFDPGDYGWLRGSLPDAGAGDAADWQAIKAYLDRCQANPPRDEAALAALGYRPPADYWSAYRDDVCSEVTMAGWTAQGFKDWPSYSRALAGALPAYRTYLFAVSQAVAVAPTGQGELRDQLHVAIIPDQMLRNASVWGQGDAADAPALDEDSRRVLVAMLWRAIRDQDRRNTAWIKAVVAKHGWPRISQVGELAASNAWLIVQHADDDPIFQLRMLRLMEPLLAGKEVVGSNYALLYDRVMLPLTGKQRYGSQFICGEQGWQPRPLEDEAHVDQRRKSVGLQPLADYRKSLIAAFGERCSR